MSPCPLFHPQLMADQLLCGYPDEPVHPFAHWYTLKLLSASLSSVGILKICWKLIDTVFNIIDSQYLSN